MRRSERQDFDDCEKIRTGANYFGATARVQPECEANDGHMSGTRFANVMEI